MKSNLHKKLKNIADEIDAIILDLSEVTVMVDVDFQAKRLEKVNDKLKNASTQIHGGGTGDN